MIKCEILLYANSGPAVLLEFQLVLEHKWILCNVDIHLQFLSIMTMDLRQN